MAFQEISINTPAADTSLSVTDEDSFTIEENFGETFEANNVRTDSDDENSFPLTQGHNSNISDPVLLYLAREQQLSDKRMELIKRRS